MGIILEDLDGHEGYADRRLPDGRLAGGVWSRDTREFTGYVAACGCGWQASNDHEPSIAGRKAAVAEWLRGHGEPLLAHQAQQRRAALSRLLRSLGGTAEHLDNPAQLTRISRAADQLRELTAAVRRDQERRLTKREVDDER